MNHIQVCENKPFRVLAGTYEGDLSLTLEARRQYLDAVRERYRNSTRAQKTRILDEFCEVCHYSRSYAIRVLLAPKAGRTRRPGPARVYDQRILVHLVRLWNDMGKICSKSMVAAIPAWLPHYGHPDFDEELRDKLLRISAPTIDRLLQPLKQGPVKGLSTTKPSAWIKSRIPIAVL